MRHLAQPNFVGCTTGNALFAVGVAKWIGNANRTSHHRPHYVTSRSSLRNSGFHAPQNATTDQNVARESQGLDGDVTPL